MLRRSFGVPMLTATILAAAANTAIGQDSARVRLAARSTPQTALYLAVTDSAGHPIANAEVSAIQGLSTVLSMSRSDAYGKAALRVRRDSTEIQIVVRRLGFHPSTQFLLADRDSIEIDFRLATVQTLPRVAVTAQENVKRKSYYVDADEIAHSQRLILNGMDVLTKMKPDILEGRAPGCGVQNIYVNGVRIVNPPRDEMAIAHIPSTRLSRVNLPGGLVVSRMSSSSAAGNPSAPLSTQEAIWSIMWTIRAEHVEQMEYKDCFDTSMPGLHANSALYVVLKPGVAYEPGRGSYVADAGEHGLARSVDLPEGSNRLPAYRRRVLGVYDPQTGAPIAGVEVRVRDSTYATTSSDGLTTISFLPPGPSTLRIRKSGFQDLVIDVTITPNDTNPLTLVLKRRD